MSPTTLFTFMLYFPSRPHRVHLYGSWDNFQQPYPLERDKQKASGHWTGCHYFNDICNSPDIPLTPSLNHDPTGLKQGHTYFYFYKLDDEDWFDPAMPYTSFCPMMPGQPVNILEVPVERPMSVLSMPMTIAAVNEEEVAAAEKAKRRHRMMRLGRKRPISEEEGRGEKRRERSRGEWMVKGVRRISNVVGLRLGSRREEEETKVDPKKMESFPTLQEQPRWTSSAPTLPSVENANVRSLRESLGTMSLTFSTTTEQAQFETPQLQHSEFAYEQSPPSLYHSTTSSLQATPSSLLITPKTHLNNAKDNGKDEQRILPPVTINSNWLDTPRLTSEQDEYLIQPQAFSRHTLRSPFSPLPSQIFRVCESRQETITLGGVGQNDEQQAVELSTFHPFFRLGARVSTHAGAPRLSRANTEMEEEVEENEREAKGLGLELMRHECGWRKESGTTPRLGLGVAEIDLEEVNRRLMQTEKVFIREEFGWMSAAIF